MAPRRPFVLAVALVSALASEARAEPEARTAPSAAAARAPTRAANDFYQFGVSLLADGVVGRGRICESAPQSPCILGPGGGAAIRVGYRSDGPWFVGGVYEFAKLDAGNLYRLAILQTARADARWMIEPEARFAPYVTFGVGASAYGNEWGVDTGGAAASLGLGVEGQLSRTSLLGVALAYRPVFLDGWTDGSGAHRSASLVQFVGLELVIEQRSPTTR